MYMKVWPKGRAPRRECALEKAAAGTEANQYCGEESPVRVTPDLPARAFPALASGHEYLARCTRVAGHAGIHISRVPRSRRYGKAAGKVFVRWGDPLARACEVASLMCRTVFCSLCTTRRTTRRGRQRGLCNV